MRYLILLMIVSSVKTVVGQKVFSVAYASRADVKIFVVKY